MPKSRSFLDRLENLQPYNTEQEKNALIKAMDKHCPLDICRILGVEPHNNLEAEAFIYKLREISVGDIIEVTSVCPSCKNRDANYINIPKMFFQQQLDASVSVGLFEDISELPESDIEIINNMTLDEYSIIEKTIKENNNKIFNPISTSNCRKCENTINIKVNYKDIISKFGIKNIYEQYLDISYYTNMTKKDTDGMLPFEREIFLGLIQNKEDEKSKKNKK